MEKTMENNTTNENTNMTTNVTGDKVSESGMLDGLVDVLSDSPELILMSIVIAAMAAYIAYTQPAVKALIMPYIKKYDDEILAALEKGLTKTQMKAYEKLDDAAQKHVKDAMLRNVVLSAWDENDDALVALVKSEAKKALNEARS